MVEIKKTKRENNRKSFAALALGVAETFKLGLN